MKSWLFLAISLLFSAALPVNAEGKDDFEKELQLQISPTLQAGCNNPKSDLARVLCNKRLRVGVRANYQLFSEFDGTNFKGFEVELAKTIAKHLGVKAEFIRVKPADRIENLRQDNIDTIIATMAHTVSRDARIFLFVHITMPHPPPLWPPRKEIFQAGMTYKERLFVFRLETFQTSYFLNIASNFLFTIGLID